MTYKLKADYVFLGEGAADNALIRRLSEIRDLPVFDCPFPDGIRPQKKDKKNGETVSKDREAVGGRDNFGEMLKLLDPVIDEQRSTRGILIATDCGDDGKKAFDSVAKQVAATGFYPRPEKPGQAVSANAKQSVYLPKLVIVMVPGKDKIGGLETLCVEVLRDRHPQTAECLDQYLACLDGKGVGIDDWGAETRSKAEMQCLIAVTNKNDPNKAGRYVFSTQKGGKPPVIDVTHPAFDALADDLKKAIAALS